MCRGFVYVFYLTSYYEQLNTVGTQSMKSPLLVLALELLDHQRTLIYRSVTILVVWPLRLPTPSSNTILNPLTNK